MPIFFLPHIVIAIAGSTNLGFTAEYIRGFFFLVEGRLDLHLAPLSFSPHSSTTYICVGRWQKTTFDHLCEYVDEGKKEIIFFSCVQRWHHLP